MKVKVGVAEGGGVLLGVTDGGTKSVEVRVAVGVGVAESVGVSEGDGVVGVAGMVGEEVGVVVGPSGARWRAIHPMQ